MSSPRAVLPRQLGEVMDAVAQGCVVAIPGDGGYQLAVRVAHPEALGLLRGPGASADAADRQIVVGDRAQAEALTMPWTKQTSILTDRMWPGPLTVILPARPDGLVSGTEDAVVRLTMPAWRPLRTLAHRSGPLAVSLLRDGDGEPLVSADDVLSRVGDADEVAFVVDGGLRRGPTSTVVDCTRSPPKVQRVGALPESYVEAALLMGARKRTLFTRRSPDHGSR
jgi:L-threonylcarbamoyladenylate synthase